jgi:S-adenosylmethionine-diacylgycerolhomoserine-N-methlytransferase
MGSGHSYSSADSAMGFYSDLKILYHLTLRPIRGSDHATRLESFYSGQADGYDRFRSRLLKGRGELCAAIDFPECGTWVDLGGGTGANLERIGGRLQKLSRVQVVDLSRALLRVADRRIAQHGWTNVETVEADATTYQPEAPADVVTFSYSLTMIPDWLAAVDNARRMLRDGGLIGVVDFYVSRKYPSDGTVRHGWFTRSFWPIWFAADNVFPCADHVPYLHRCFQPIRFEEHRAKLPYLPLLKAPYYLFVGKSRTPCRGPSG